MRSCHTTIANIQCYLKEFNKQCQKGEYKKCLDYSVWRYLTSKNHYNEKIHIIESLVAISFSWGDNPPMFLDKNTNDLAKFLMNDKSFCTMMEESEHKVKEVFIDADDTPSSYNIIGAPSKYYGGTAGAIRIDTGVNSASWTISDIPPLISNVSTNTETYLDMRNNYMTKQDFDNFVNKDVIFNKKENDNNMKGFNFDFGPCTNDNIRMSVYGLAVKNTNDTWVSYDTNSGEVMDVDILNFDGRKFMFKMPVAIDNIEIGDVIIHNRVPVFVDSVSELGNIIAIDPRAGERKEIMLTKSPFGFNFVTKVVSLFGNMLTNSEASADKPFGNNPMLFALMAGDNPDMKDMLPMMMLSQGQMDMNNPLMMYMLMSGDKDNKDSMLPLLMMNMMNNTPKSKRCTCKVNHAN